jgi:hypothetical protein
VDLAAFERNSVRFCEGAQSELLALVARSLKFDGAQNESAAGIRAARARSFSG